MPSGTFDSDQERTVIASRRDRASLRPGDKILNETYVIERLLGKGGMGEVYQAEHIELGSKRAIKIVSPEFSQDDQYVGLFIEEARKLSRVNNDAIVRYYEFSRGESGARYLVMEYVDGESLADILKERRLEPHEVIELLHRVGQGLASAYAQGIKAHRDISPANILLPGGRVDLAKVIDFGIAKSADPAGGTLIGSDFAGKFSFVSPEQAGLYGGQEEVNERSDIYSLGLLLAAAAIGSGGRLDMGSEPASVIRARQSVPDLSRVPAELHPLLTRMLQPRPQDRPASMRALAVEAETLLQDRPAGGSRSPAHGGKWRWALVGGITAAGLAAAATFVLWPRPEPVPPRVVEKSHQPAPLTPAIAMLPDPARPHAEEKPVAPGGATLTPTVAVVPKPAPRPPHPTAPDTPPPEAIVAPPPPAVVKPLDPRAELTAAMAHLDCASLRTTAGPGGKDVIAGTVSVAADQANLIAIAARMPEPERPRLDIEIVAPPVCEVLAQFGDWQTAGIAAAGGVEIRLSGGAKTLHENDPIAVDVTSKQNSPVSLRIDYFTLGGQVLHMWPNAEMATAAVAASGTQEFLKSGARNKVWRVGGAPFGVELITVVATRSPLDFGRELPLVETASDYLGELKRALQRAGPGPRPLTASVLVHTAEK
ncbi:MAG TPA: protein kinase [Stellaceae bacterium]|jgi:hypothetical protein